MQYILIFLLIAGSVMLPFVSNNYAFYLIGLGIIWGMLSISADMVHKLGLASIAQAGFMGIGMYSVGIGMTKLGMSWWLCSFIGMVVSVIVGIGLGFITLRMKGHYFAIGTLSFGVVIQKVFEGFEGFTEGNRGIVGIPAISPIKIGGFEIFSFDSGIATYYLILCFLAVIVMIFIRMSNSPFGRTLETIRSSESLAAALGINVTRYKVVTFGLSSVIASLSGSIFAPYLGYIHPADASVHNGFCALVYAVIGGTGTWYGPIIGAQLMVAVPEMLRFLQDYRLLIFGVLIMIFIIFIPHGIAGILKSIINGIQTRFLTKDKSLPLN